MKRLSSVLMILGLLALGSCRSLPEGATPQALFNTLTPATNIRVIPQEISPNVHFIYKTFVMSKPMSYQNLLTLSAYLLNMYQGESVFVTEEGWYIVVVINPKAVK